MLLIPRKSFFSTLITPTHSGLINIIAAMCLGLLLTISTYTSAGEIDVVVNINNPVNTITKKELSMLFLARHFTFSTGARATILNITDKDPLKSEFYQKITGLPLKKIRNKWAAVVFSGQAEFPKEFETAQGVINSIRENKNAIGYLDAADVTNEVKVIYRLLP